PRISKHGPGRRRSPGSHREAARAVIRRVMLLMLAAALATAPARAQERRAVEAEDAARPRELVVLVHGLGRTSLSMWPLARALEREGFEVLNWGYSSLCCSV